MAAKKNPQQEATSAQPVAAAPTLPAEMTKVEAVRRCLKVLGKNATRTEIQTYVKDHFGIEITKQHATNCKGVILRRKAKKKLTKTKPVAAMTGETKPQVQPAAASTSSAKESGILLEDIEVIKAL